LTRFTSSPYEMMMTQKPSGGGKSSRFSVALPPGHPCYGCGNAGQKCIGICQRELNQFLQERRKQNEAGNR
jgi:hypothetical protein